MIYNQLFCKKLDAFVSLSINDQDRISVELEKRENFTLHRVTYKDMHGHFILKDGKWVTQWALTLNRVDCWSGARFKETTYEQKRKVVDILSEFIEDFVKTCPDKMELAEQERQENEVKRKQSELKDKIKQMEQMEVDIKELSKEIVELKKKYSIK